MEAEFRNTGAGFQRLCLGYTENASYLAAQLPGRLGRDLRHYYNLLIGTNAYILRPGTPLTQEWYAELLRRMEKSARALAKSPGVDSRGRNPGYPLRYTELLGDIFQPLVLKYHDRVLHDERIKPVFRGYM